VSHARREVRASVEFFEDLDRQLPAERREGTPSRSDFQAYDLLEIVEAFASGSTTCPSSSLAGPTIEC
jgi:hypothetical protein